MGCGRDRRGEWRTGERDVRSGVEETRMDAVVEKTDVSTAYL